MRIILGIVQEIEAIVERGEKMLICWVMIIVKKQKTEIA